MSFDVQRIRADFPLLARAVHGKPLIYFDNANTSQKPRVGDRGGRPLLPRVQRERLARGAHARRRGDRGLRGHARQARALHQRAVARRDRVHQRHHAGDQLWSPTAMRCRVCKPGDEILVTTMEHHANIVPWQLVAATHGREAQGRADHAERRIDRRGIRRAADAAREARRRHARVERARHDQSGARARAKPVARAAFRCWSTARRPRRICRSTCRRSAAISTR